MTLYFSRKCSDYSTVNVICFEERGTFSLNLSGKLWSKRAR